MLLGISNFSISQTDLHSINKSHKPEVKVYDSFEDFSKNHLKPPSENGKIRVVNFWATWCKPCVKELPHILALANSNSNIELLLVSLDMKKDLDKKLKTFLIKNDIRHEVVLLADNDANSWVSKIDQSWEGSIPATLFISFNSKKFFEQEFESFDELKEIIGELH